MRCGHLSKFFDPWFTLPAYFSDVFAVYAHTGAMAYVGSLKLARRGQGIKTPVLTTVTGEISHTRSNTEVAGPASQFRRIPA